MPLVLSIVNSRHGSLSAQVPLQGRDSIWGNTSSRNLFHSHAPRNSQVKGRMELSPRILRDAVLMELKLSGTGEILIMF